MAQGRGELESLVAGPAIASSAQQRLQLGGAGVLAQLDISKITAHDVAAAARQGDRLAVDIFHRAGRLLGFAVANLVSLLDPEVIILGGGLAVAADLYLGPLREAMHERAQPLAADKVRVVVSRIAETVNLLGCALLAWAPGATTLELGVEVSSSTKKHSRTKKETK